MDAPFIELHDRQSTAVLPKLDSLRGLIDQDAAASAPQRPPAERFLMPAAYFLSSTGAWRSVLIWLYTSAASLTIAVPS